MRTNIMINDSVMEKAMSISEMKTKKEVVERALQEYITNHSRKDLSDLRGKISFADDYDYKAARGGR